MPDRIYSDSELDAAIEELSDPARLREGQELVSRVAPSLQRVLAAALQDGGWFDDAHARAVRDATDAPDPQDRVRAVRELMAEETRLSMLVGVAVGFALAGTLEGRPQTQDPTPQPED